MLRRTLGAQKPLLPWQVAVAPVLDLTTLHARASAGGSCYPFAGFATRAGQTLHLHVRLSQLSVNADRLTTLQDAALLLANDEVSEFAGERSEDILVAVQRERVAASHPGGR